MAEYTLAGLQPGPFLAEVWQRRPLLLRGALPGFRPPIDGDDLAGLACEPMAESRLVTGSLAGGGWSLRHGPFEEADFTGLGERDWTLLVQDVDKHYPPLAELLDAFAFLPRWRLDDIMVSFAAPGGGVGPHVDQYDVFLLQAQGRRRWEIALAFDEARMADVPLDMLARFEPEQSWVLEPGDMLYLPPGVAHHGVAIDAGLTYSIGLRAPSAADLLLGLGEWLGEQHAQGGRYADPGLAPAGLPGEVDAGALARLRTLLSRQLEDDVAFNAFVGDFLARFRLAHAPAPPPRRARRPARQSKPPGALVYRRHPWTRLCWLRQGEGALLCAPGGQWACSTALAVAVCGAQPVVLDAATLPASDRAVVEALAQAGHLLAEAPDSRT